MKTRRIHQRRPSMESLESRRVCAIAASIEGGWLVLRGDGSNASVAVSKGSSADSVVVAGVRTGVTAFSPGVATPVNHQQAPVELNGFTGGIRAQMGDGSGTLFVSNLDIRGSLIVEQGQGGNGLVIGGNAFVLQGNQGPLAGGGSVRVRGALSAVGGNDSDFINLSGNVHVDLDTVLIGLGGNDVVNIAPTAPFASPPSSFSTANLIVDLGAGKDVVSADGVSAGALVVNTGSGGDQVAFGGNLFPFASVGTRARSIVINTGSEGDTVFLDAAFARDLLLIDAGAGADNVSLSGVQATTLIVVTGDGFDTIVLKQGSARVAVIDSGRHADQVQISDSVFDHLGVYLGWGADSLSVQNVTVNGFFDADGGGDADSLFRLGGNKFARFSFRSF